MASAATGHKRRRHSSANSNSVPQLQRSAQRRRQHQLQHRTATAICICPQCRGQVVTRGVRDYHIARLRNDYDHDRQRTQQDIDYDDDNELEADVIDVGDSVHMDAATPPSISPPPTILVGPAVTMSAADMDSMVMIGQQLQAANGIDDIDVAVPHAHEHVHDAAHDAAWSHRVYDNSEIDGAAAAAMTSFAISLRNDDNDDLDDPQRAINHLLDSLVHQNLYHRSSADHLSDTLITIKQSLGRLLPDLWRLPATAYRARSNISRLAPQIILAQHHVVFDVCTDECGFIYRKMDSYDGYASLSSRVKKCRRKGCTNDRYDIINGVEKPKRQLHWFPLVPRIQKLFKLRAWVRAISYASTRQRDTTNYSDIYDGLLWQRFRAHYADTIDLPSHYHLAFSMTADGWLMDGKTRSITVASGMLLNLPPWLRSLVPNMWNFIIFPPHSKHVKHWMHPVMQEFAHLSTNGININHDGVDARGTAHVKATILFDVNDLAAAFRWNGAPGHGAHKGSCHRCNIVGSTVPGGPKGTRTVFAGSIGLVPTIPTYDDIHDTWCDTFEDVSRDRTRDHHHHERHDLGHGHDSKDEKRSSSIAAPVGNDSAELQIRVFGGRRMRFIDDDNGWCAIDWRPDGDGDGGGDHDTGMAHAVAAPHIPAAVIDDYNHHRYWAGKFQRYGYIGRDPNGNDDIPSNNRRGTAAEGPHHKWESFITDYLPSYSTIDQHMVDPLHGVENISKLIINILKRKPTAAALAHETIRRTHAGLCNLGTCLIGTTIVPSINDSDMNDAAVVAAAEAKHDRDRSRVVGAFPVHIPAKKDIPPPIVRTNMTRYWLTQAVRDQVDALFNSLPGGGHLRQIFAHTGWLKGFDHSIFMGEPGIFLIFDSLTDIIPLAVRDAIIMVMRWVTAMHRKVIPRGEVNQLEHDGHIALIKLEMAFPQQINSISKHHLHHWAQIIRLVGPLWTIHMYGIERLNGSMIKMLRGYSHPEMELARQLMLRERLADQAWANNHHHDYLPSATKKGRSSTMRYLMQPSWFTGQHIASSCGAGVAYSLTRYETMAMYHYVHHHYHMYDTWHIWWQRWVHERDDDGNKRLFPQWLTDHYRRIYDHDGDGDGAYDHNNGNGNYNDDAMVQLATAHPSAADHRLHLLLPIKVQCVAFTKIKLGDSYTYTTLNTNQLKTKLQKKRHVRARQRLRDRDSDNDDSDDSDNSDNDTMSSDNSSCSDDTDDENDDGEEKKSVATPSSLPSLSSVPQASRAPVSLLQLVHDSINPYHINNSKSTMMVRLPGHHDPVVVRLHKLISYRPWSTKQLDRIKRNDSGANMISQHRDDITQSRIYCLVEVAQPLPAHAPLPLVLLRHCHQPLEHAIKHCDIASNKDVLWLPISCIVPRRVTLAPVRQSLVAAHLHHAPYDANKFELHYVVHLRQT